MAFLKYDEIFSRFYTRVTAYDFWDMDEALVKDYQTSWLQGAYSKPFVRRIFSEFAADDAYKEIGFELTNSIDESSDQSFVLEILSLGMAIEWLEPKVNSFLNIMPMVASKEEKFYSQANHLAELRNTLDYFKKAQRQLIVDRNSYYNGYLGGGDTNGGV